MNLTHCVYVIECLTPGYFYVGETSHLKHRFQSHVNGTGAKFTKIHGVKQLVHVEYVSSSKIAKQLEREYLFKLDNLPNVKRVAGAGRTRTLEPNPSA